MLKKVYGLRVKYNITDSDYFKIDINKNTL